MTVDEAVDIVARHLVYKLVVENSGECWEDYPELGEFDWNDVAKRALKLAPHPGLDEFAEAMNLLEARAES